MRGIPILQVIALLFSLSCTAYSQENDDAERCLNRKGNPTQIIEACTLVLSVVSINLQARAIAYSHRAEAYTLVNEEKAAKEDFAEAYNIFGSLAERRGDWWKAEREYRTALSFRSDHKPAREGFVRALQKRINLAKRKPKQELSAVAGPTPPAAALSRDLVERVQRQLNALGFDAGPADGILGQRTRTAVIAFQKDIGLPPDGDISDAVLVHLDHAVAEAAKAPKPTRDTTPPVIITAERLETQAESVGIEGTVTDDGGNVSRIFLSSSRAGRWVSVGRDGRFRNAVAVPMGESSVRLRTQGAIGNHAEVTVTVVRRPPSAPPPKAQVAAAMPPELVAVEAKDVAPAVGSVAPAETAALTPATQGLAASPAERRVALVIGNGAYRHEAALSNPSNDARAVAAAPRRLGFEVTEGIDLDRGGMEDALLAFARAAEGADDALAFYAGHGMQVNGRNYLLPVDTRLEDERDLRRYPTADQIIADAAGARRVALVILDACRDNPFARSLARRMGTRSVDVRQGLAAPGFTPANTLIAYATAADAVAVDAVTAGSEATPHSPFTAALLRHLEEPGLEVRLLFGKVRDAVFEVTRGKQVPFTYGSLGGTEIYLAGVRG